MKILKLIKQKDNTYKLKFQDNEDIILYDDIIIKYHLLIEKNIDEKDLDNILKENEELGAYYKSLKYLNRKIRTKKEVKNYLSKIYETSIIDKTIKKLELEGYLNEERYIKAYITDQINLTNHGPHKIINNLVNLGFNKEQIIPFINNIDEEIFNNKIIKYIEKKIKTNHKYSNTKLREKIIFELNNLGYEKNLIIENLNNYEIDTPDNLLEKEYQKIYSKLSLKYTGYDLEARLINKLAQKGFNYNEIKEIISQNKS